MTLENQSMELIYEGKNSFIYHQPNGPYNGPVVIKVLNADVPTPRQLVSINNEYMLTKDTGIEGVRAAVDTIRIEDKPAVVMAHFSGQTLAQAFVNTRQSLDIFLEFAVKIANILANVHAHQIIHMDVNSHNILVNLESREVMLIDFGLASRLAMQTQYVGNLDSLSGTPAYMSPEQTGRMNRNIDYRSDLYSLGVTFYEMLTGQTPFEADDLLEMVHAHMAKPPISVSDVSPDVPKIVSDIVMRLLEKNAEDRYQSAEGLRADLSYCRTLLERGDDLKKLPPRYFKPGLNDSSGRLHISEKLYGRTDAIRVLLTLFEQASSGEQALLMLKGEPGTGKSATVAELYKPVTGRKAYFISGKFDQYLQHKPYIPFKSAFDQLVGLLMAERDSDFSQWIEDIRCAVGGNGAVLTELIPSLEKILGPQPPVPRLNGPEHKNRFNLTLMSFLNAICTSNHPIVFFIDDWQWADQASLELLGSLLLSDSKRYFMLIGAYRSSEVDEGHPLTSIMGRLNEAGVSIETVHLKNLNRNEVGELIQDSLACSSSECDKLTDLVYRKTDGNPLFVRQFLQNLNENEWLRFDFDRRKWRWNTEQINAQDMTDNVAVLMAKKLGQFTPGTARIVQRAACLGNEFDLWSLAVISKQSVKETLERLSEILNHGLVFPLNDFYKSVDTAHDARFRFLHDRVQQAAFAQIPINERRHVQLEIGRLLLKHAAENTLDQRLFDILEHYNQAVSIVTDNAERRQLAELNLRSADMAGSTAAFHSARAYLDTAFQMMPEDGWTSDYELMLTIHLKFAKALFLSGRFGQMDAICRATKENARTLSDGAQVDLVQIQSLLARGDLMAAVDAGLTFIEELGITVDRDPNPDDAMQYLKDTAQWLTDERIDSLLDLNDASIENSLIVEVATLVNGALYGANVHLFSVFAARIVRLCVEEGVAPWSPSILGAVALLFSAILHDIPKARHLTEVTTVLARERFPLEVQTPLLGVSAGGFVLHRHDHLAATLPIFEEGMKKGLATGNVHGAICTWWHAWHHLFVGTALSSVKRICEEAMDSCRRMQATRLKEWCSTVYEAVCNLEGEETDKPCHLTGRKNNLQRMLDLAIRSNDFSEVFRIKFYRAWLSFVFDKYQEAADQFEDANAHLIFGAGLYFIPLFHFYDTLAAARAANAKPPHEQESTLDRINKNLKAIEIWVQFAPMNHQHKQALMLAERARLEGEYWSAMTHYTAAISGARKNGFTNEEALSCEMFGKFLLEQEVRQAGVAYLRIAHNLYAIWGARQKALQLKPFLAVRHPHYHNALPNETAFSNDEPVTHHTTSTGQLDLKTILKVNQTLSQTMLLSDLLTRMIQILLENAGAQKACILYREDDEWFVAAEGEESRAISNTGAGVPLQDVTDLSKSVFNYVVHTGEAMLVSDALEDPRVRSDAYLQENKVRSVLCLPVHHKGTLKLVLYLENSLSNNAFTEERLELLRLLSGQMAISLENAIVVEDLKASISRRKRAEVSLRKYERIVAGSKDLVALFDRRYVHEAVNDAYLTYLGCERKDTIGRTVVDVMGEEIFTDGLKAALDQALQGEDVNYQRYIEFKGTGRRYMDVSCSPFYGDRNEIDAVVFISRDTTETRKLEDQLTQTQKIEAIGTLASGIAHDFNNILGGVLGFTELALMEATEGTALNRHLKLVQSSAERAKELVKQILAFSRQSEETAIQIAISKVLRDVLKLVRASLPSTIEIRTTVQEKGYGIVADPVQIHQIFMNLCTNAHHAMKKTGGILTIDINLMELDENCDECPHDLKTGTYIRAIVRDNGHGMDAATREKIFEPYFTTKQKGMGTGLGLAMVHGIMKKKGGTVTVESEPGRGATFSLYFPAIPLSQNQSTQRVSDVPTGMERIMLIDDEPQLLDVGEQMLGRLGYKVETVSSSKTALETFRANPEFYDLVITDMTMPYMTGDKLAEEILQIRPNLPVILCSGFVEESLEKRVKKLGIRSIIMKPLLMGELAKAVREGLDQMPRAVQER